MNKVLIVEDDITFSKILSTFLNRNQYSSSVTHSVQDACTWLASETPALILLDYRLPDGTGMDLLEFLNAHNLHVPVIMMTGFHDIKTAVQAIKKGAQDYITKPINQEELLMLMKGLPQQYPKAKEAIEKAPAVFVKGNSALSQQIQKHIELVASTGMSVLIQGESGTGKEHVARTIHELSTRNKAPFVAIDCGALSADLAASELFGHVKGAFTGALQDKTGQFEAANGGTLFLDEVGNLNYEIQVKLLRALQERVITPVGSNTTIPFDVRIITASNEDFRESMRKNMFREDLYHRINEFKIKLPSLTERREDLQEFVRFFILQANKELNKQVTGISTEVQKLFDSYNWPGNIRELKNMIKRGVLLATGPLITTEELPEEMELSVEQAQHTGRQDANLKAQQENMERQLIEKTLKEVRYNKSKAAKILNIDRTTLYYKMAKYHIGE
ncbi:MAG TPA: sigma-54 dependent transcriptional regulator [Chitinophagaceae bacterium]|nr:sigma-54 dependent transcriptional regulator [Chitinophagaceae bacterium]